MSQLKPFVSHWHRNLDVPSTFPQLPQLIDGCTNPANLMSLKELKEELKVAAMTQDGKDATTKDLNRLQARLQKVIGEEREKITAEFDAPQEEDLSVKDHVPAENHAPDQDVSVQEKEIDKEQNQEDALQSKQSSPNVPAVQEPTQDIVDQKNQANDDVLVSSPLSLIHI